MKPAQRIAGRPTAIVGRGAERAAGVATNWGSSSGRPLGAGEAAIRSGAAAGGAAPGGSAATAVCQCVGGYAGAGYAGWRGGNSTCLDNKYLHKMQIWNRNRNEMYFLCWPKQTYVRDALRNKAL